MVNRPARGVCSVVGIPDNTTAPADHCPRRRTPSATPRRSRSAARASLPATRRTPPRRPSPPRSHHPPTTAPPRMARRDHIPAFCDLAQVLSMRMDGCGVDWLENRVEHCVCEGGGLILSAHEIDAQGGHGIDPETLRAFCSNLAQRGDVWVDTIGAVGDFIAGERLTIFTKARRFCGGS